MILIDTGPLVSLFDPKDADHRACHRVLGTVTEQLSTTLAVLTEALHLLDPKSRGAEALKDFVLSDFLAVTSLDRAGLERCFELMGKYADLPMDFADATLVHDAERFQTGAVFTLDFRDFGTYRFRKGHRNQALELVGRDVLE